MVKGLVFGKFYPLHNGHISLIHYASERCDQLHVLVCASSKEEIPGRVRKRWVEETFSEIPSIHIHLLEYDEHLLPNASEASREVSRIWADHFHTLYPDLDIIFTSEPYGEYLAEFMDISHDSFDQDRKNLPVSSTQIRQYPFKYWEFLPKAVRPYYTKKIVLLGTESTGKSTLSLKLAKYYNTVYAEETGREIIPHTSQCTYEYLLLVAEKHAQNINDKLRLANKFLFIDTDIHITQSYSQYLFKKKLEVETWIMEANEAELYLFLDKDAAFVQDGTRLDQQMRNQLHQSHLQTIEKAGINYHLIGGSWQNRFASAITLINNYMS